MLPILEKLTGFSKRYFTPGDIAAEFEHKFGDTHLLINNSLVYILGFDTKRQALISKTPIGEDKFITEKEIKTISPWKPNTGWYLCSITRATPYFVFISKTANKNFKKSFSFANNYSINLLKDRRDISYIKEDQNLSFGYISDNRKILVTSDYLYINNINVGKIEYNNNIKNLKINIPKILESEISEFINKEFIQ